MERPSAADGTGPQSQVGRWHPFQGKRKRRRRSDGSLATLAKSSLELPWWRLE